MRLIGIIIIAIILILSCVLAGLNEAGILVFEGGVELSSLLLSAATLVVTGVGVVAALLAIFGYEQIKIAAVHAARTESRTVAEEAAKPVAEKVASVVAARTAREASVSTTTEEQANNIISTLDSNDNY